MMQYECLYLKLDGTCSTSVKELTSPVAGDLLVHESLDYVVRHIAGAKGSARDALVIATEYVRSSQLKTTKV